MIKRYNQYTKDNTTTLNEKIGVTSDGEALSDFLIGYLSKAEVNKTYIFVKSEFEEDTKKMGIKSNDMLLKSVLKDKEMPEVVIVPDLPKFENNIYKVYVNYVDVKLPYEAWFDPTSSKYTKNGYILYFTFLYKPDKDKIWKHVVYHEIHHSMQFVSMTKKKFGFNRKNIRMHILQKYPKTNVLLKDFLNYYYHSIKTEQDAVIAQFYGKLKHRKSIKSITDLESVFKKRNIYEYRIAHSMAYCDLKKLFNLKMKNRQTGEIADIMTKDELKEFFSILKYMGAEMNKCKNIEEFTKLQQQASKDLTDIPLISDEELEATIDKYTKYFRKVGRNMIKKLDKTYALLRDHYIDEFKNGPAPKKVSQIETDLKKIEPIKKFNDLNTSIHSDNWD